VHCGDSAGPFFSGHRPAGGLCNEWHMLKKVAGEVPRPPVLIDLYCAAKDLRVAARKNGMDAKCKMQNDMRLRLPVAFQQRRRHQMRCLKPKISQGGKFVESDAGLNPQNTTLLSVMQIRRRDGEPAALYFPNGRLSSSCASTRLCTSRISPVRRPPPPSRPQSDPSEQRSRG
jgi:hypothetical protein